MKLIYIIVALWTGGDGEDFYKFSNPTFETKQHCIEYARRNFLVLNRHVNQAHNSDYPYPNTFYCISEKEWKKHTSHTSI